MKKLLLLLLLTPFFSNAQVVNTILRKNTATKTIYSYSSGSAGNDTLANVYKLDAFTEGQVPAWDATNKRFIASTVSLAGINTYVFTRTNSDISGYKQAVSLNNYVEGLRDTATAGASTTPVLLQEFATNVGYPNITVIPIGEFNVFYETKKDAGTQNYWTYAIVYKRSLAGTETVIDTTEISSVTSDNTLKNVDISFLNPANITLLSTDRIVVKVYARMQSGTANISLYSDDATYARLTLPAASVDATNFVPYVGATKDLVSAFDITADSLNGNGTDITGVVHTTGNETVNGIKTFQSTTNMQQYVYVDAPNTGDNTEAKFGARTLNDLTDFGTTGQNFIKSGIWKPRMGIVHSNAANGLGIGTNTGPIDFSGSGNVNIVSMRLNTGRLGIGDTTNVHYRLVANSGNAATEFQDIAIGGTTGGWFSGERHTFSGVYGTVNTGDKIGSIVVGYDSTNKGYIGLGNLFSTSNQTGDKFRFFASGNAAIGFDNATDDFTHVLRVNGLTSGTGFRASVANGFSVTGPVGNPAYMVIDQSVNNSAKKWRFGNTGAIGGYSSFDIYNETDNATPFSIQSNSVILTGTPTSTTPADGDNSTKIATTAFVKSSIPSGSISLSGNASATTFDTAIEEFTTDKMILQATSSEAAKDSYLIRSGGTWQIVFLTAPATGTNNITFNYIVKY